MFGSGVTVRSLADRLHEKLCAENPHMLFTLHEKEKERIEQASDCNHLCAGAEDGDLEEGGELNLGSTSGKSDCFEECVLANRELFEGLRGVLTLMVLWDHFHGNEKRPMQNTWRADTSMFILLSGFTTTLQLRSTRVNTFSAEYKGWDWGSFLFARFVGIFPVLWLSLILNAWRWNVNEEYYINSQIFSRQNTSYYMSSHVHNYNPKVTADKCVVLFVMGIQMWSNDLCKNFGPHDVYYASVLWSCFLIYSIIRCAINLLQWQLRRKLLDSSSASHRRLTAPETSVTPPSRDWKTSFEQVCRNQMDFYLCAQITLLWLCLFFPLFFLSGVSVRGNNIAL